MDPDPIVAGGPGPIKVRESRFFDDGKGKLLLERFRDLGACTWNDADGSFRDVSELIDDKYIKDMTNIRADAKTMAPERKRIREEWRVARINLYNNLFLIILGAENGKWKDWCGDSGTLLGRGDKVFEDKFTESGSIYKHLLDYIHENDDVMFKFYHAKDFNKLHEGIPEFKMTYFWFYHSMVKYRDHLISPVIAILEDNQEENFEEGLEAASKEFNAMIENSGKKSWRYKARMFWLLSRFQHASFTINKFKTLEYVGPVGVLCRKISRQENWMLLDDDKNFADKVKIGTKPSTLDYSSLLAYACAKNDHGLVSHLLKGKEEFEGDPEYDFRWEDRWKDTWAKALWHAAYNGNGDIVKDLLLERNIPSLTKYYSEKGFSHPLHEAARRGHESVVAVFCAAESVSISCHDQDKYNSRKTPLELATEHLKSRPDLKRRIQSMLLNKSEVNRGLEESQVQTDLVLSSANAIMVGAALIAGVTYAGWLQPPLGYHPYYQFTEPVPDAKDEPLSYMFVQGHTTIRVFAIFNSLSFFFAIAAIVAGMETTCYIGELEEMYMTRTVKNLRHKLKRTRALFNACVSFVLVAFSSAAIAVLPPIMRFRKDMYVTIAVGGFICMAMMFLFTVSKRRVFNRAKKYLGCMFTKDKPYKASENGLSASFLKGLGVINHYLEEGD